MEKFRYKFSFRRHTGYTRRWRLNSWLHFFDRRINVSFFVWQERPGECERCGFRDTRTRGHICEYKSF